MCVGVCRCVGVGVGVCVCVRQRDRDRETDFKELAHSLGRLASLKCAGQAGRLETQGGGNNAARV